MDIKHNTNPGTLFLSLLFLSIPILIWGLWISVVSNHSNASQGEQVEIFQSNLPEFISSNSTITLVVLVLSLVAIGFASKGIGDTTTVLKIIRIAVIGIASIIILLQLWTMA